MYLKKILLIIVLTFWMLPLHAHLTGEERYYLEQLMGILPKGAFTKTTHSLRTNMESLERKLCLVVIDYQKVQPFIPAILQAVGRLSFLKRLTLQGFRFEQFPIAILGLQKLVKLDLSNNQIRLIPHEINCLSKLRHFYAQNNPIPFLPISLFDLNIKTIKYSPESLLYVAGRDELGACEIYLLWGM